MKHIGEVLKDKKLSKSKPKEKKEGSASKLKKVIVLKKIGDNLGKGGIGQAMRDVGYSKGYSRNPSQLTRGKAWNTLVKEFFPSEMILSKHMELLNSKKVRAISFPVKTPDEGAIEMCRASGFEPLNTAVFLGQKWVYCIVPNGDIQDKALDKLYKITNRYKETLALDDRDKYRNLTDRELAESIQKHLNFFKKK